MTNPNPYQEVCSMEPYRWSPEVERRLTGMLSAGCSAAIIAEQIGCSDRTARTLIARYRAGEPLHRARVGRPRVSSKKRRPRRSAERDQRLRRGYEWVSDISILPEEERAEYRMHVIERAGRGWSERRISNGLKLRMPIVAEMIAEWLGVAFDAPVAPKAPAIIPSRPPGRQPSVDIWWPAITASHDDWPADQRFEDCPKAIKADTAGERIVGLSHVYRMTRGEMHLQSLSSSTASWAAL